MRLATIQDQEGPRLAGWRDDGWVPLSMSDGAAPRSMKRLLADGADALQQARQAIQRGSPRPENELTFLAPIPRPAKIICVGLNYADHAREMGVEPEREPLIFNKFPTAICGHRQPIELPRCSDQVDYEAELVVAIGNPGRDIRQPDAMAHVAGYCCGHDVSARDWQKQKPGGQWLLGKSFDSFAPVGPALVTADAVDHPGSLDIKLRRNGQQLQSSNTRELIFPIDFLIHYISRVCTLQTGDLIFTGTPPGVGTARRPPVYLQPGDVVEVEIERIGVLSNPVVARS